MDCSGDSSPTRGAMRRGIARTLTLVCAVGVLALAAPGAASAACYTGAGAYPYPNYNNGGFYNLPDCRTAAAVARQDGATGSDPNMRFGLTTGT